MSMHLLGPAMTTTNYKKRKKKPLSVAQENKLKIDWKRHNKDCRRKHMHTAQFEKYEDYRAYVRGEYKAPKQRPNPLNNYQAPKVRETPNYPSLSNTISAPSGKKEPMQYTGKRKLLGIATMHKSNMVPIFEDQKEQAIEIAQMRR